MNYYNLTSAEKTYYANLTDDERKIYLANPQQLTAISTCSGYAVRAYVGVARLLDELHRIHQRYNDLIELTFGMPNTTEEEQQIFSDLQDINSELFSISIAICDCSLVSSLVDMDECDALYRYLSELKMSRFNCICYTVDIAVLIDALVSHDCL